jgi:MFS family permease
MKKTIITRTIWILSLVSFFTDMASEMLYPIMPLFLQQVGYTAVFIGVLEGLAEAIAGLSKSYFGKRSDQSGKRLPFVQFGYALSALSKPILAFVITPAWIFFSRTTDRLGKGIRTGARDALLSDETTPATKATVFGFHRSLDTMGAVAGPALALLYLYYYPNDYQNLFIIAFFPGLLAIACTFLIKEKKNVVAPGHKSRPTSFFAFAHYWRTSAVSYKRLTVGLLIFALINSSDVFLLLKMKEAGMGDTAIIGLYIFYNLIYAISAYPMGVIADKVGLKRIFMIGIFIFAFTYACFSFASNLWMFAALLFLYGIYAAATEGVAKAWISNIAGRQNTATAIATYSGFQSIAALLASSAGGLIWFYLGAPATFLFSAFIAVCVLLYFMLTQIQESQTEQAV